MSALRFLVGVLAVYRLARLVTVDDGPGDVFLRLRTSLGRYDYGPEQDADGDPVPASRWGRFIACPYCVGVWLAALLWWPVRQPSPWWDPLLGIMGLAGGQAALIRITGGPYGDRS